MSPLRCLGLALLLVLGARAFALGGELDPQAEALIQTLNRRGSRYSERREALAALVKLGDRALPSLRRAVLNPTRAQRKRRTELVAVLADIHSEERLDILRQALGYTLLRAEEVREPRAFFAAVAALAEAPPGSPQRHLWQELGGYVHKAVRTQGAEPPSARAVEGVISAFQKAQRSPELYDPERLAGVEFEFRGLLAGFEGVSDSEGVDSVGLAILYARNRVVFETLLPGQFEPRRLLPTLTPKLIAAAYRVVVKLAQGRVEGAKELLLEADHVPRLARVAGLSQLSGYGSVRILVDQLLDPQPATSSSARVGLQPFVQAESSHGTVVSALTFKRREVSRLAEEGRKVTLFNYFLVCAGVGAGGDKLLGEALASRSVPLQDAALSFVLERPGLLEGVAVREGVAICLLGRELEPARRAGIFGLIGRCGDQTYGLPILIEHVEDPDPRARVAALDALARLSGEDLDRTPGAWKAWWAARAAPREEPKAESE